MGIERDEKGRFETVQKECSSFPNSRFEQTTETLPAKEGTIAMLCLGNDVILTIIPKWETTPEEVQPGAAAVPYHLRPEGGDSTSIGSGGALPLPGKKDVPESTSVTLVHGDMMLFSGCDFEVSVW